VVFWQFCQVQEEPFEVWASLMMEASFHPARIGSKLQFIHDSWDENSLHS
jgi:hypothetical protein